MNWALLLVTALVGALTWIGIAYPGLSAAKGWPAGDWARSDNWQIGFWIGVAATLVSGYCHGQILGVLVTIAGTGVLAFAIAESVGPGVQLPARIGGALAVPWMLLSILIAIRA